MKLKYFIFPLFLFFFFFCFSSDTFAVSDVTYTVDSSMSTVTFCDDDSSNNIPLCSDFNYIHFSLTGTMDNYSSNWLQVRYSNASSGSNINAAFFHFFPDILLTISSSYRYIRTGSNAFLGSATYTVTLSENNPFAVSAPSGSLSIVENGTYDVSSYAEAVVNVPADVVQGDYHNDLVNIYHAIMVCGGVVMVLYFFYCIYRLIIKSTGGK